MDILFSDENDVEYTAEDIKESLLEVGADDCETLFIHSDVMFGKPANGFNRKKYLNTLYEVIMSLGVKWIIVPSFTYSYPNGETYDVVKSRTTMGAFNEYIRKLDNRFRTYDPILSLSVPNELRYMFEEISDNSLGKGSGLDIIHNMDNVKFLFLGAEMAECFTYVHYVEKNLEVPYRFDMKFEGTIIYPDGTERQSSQSIHTQCFGVKLPEKYVYFEEEMFNKGFLKKKKLGDKYIATISEEDAYREIKSHIENDIYYFVDGKFTSEDLIHKYTYSKENGKITHC